MVGGSLAQQGADGLWRPVGFYSKKLAPTECNYPIHDKEMLAIVRCVKHWRPELVNVEHFVVRSDHRNLGFFQQKQALGER